MGVTRAAAAEVDVRVIPPPIETAGSPPRGVVFYGQDMFSYGEQEFGRCKT